MHLFSLWKAQISIKLLEKNLVTLLLLNTSRSIGDKFDGRGTKNLLTKASKSSEDVAK